MSRKKKKKCPMLEWSCNDGSGKRLMFSLDKKGDMFVVTEKDGVHEFDLYGALAYAVEIANKYDSIGDYESEYTEGDYDDIAEGDVNASLYVELPISLSYVFILDEYATPSYRMLRPYIMESIKARAMYRSTDDHVLFCRAIERMRKSSHTK